jgi:hypothetical protein
VTNRQAGSEGPAKSWTLRGLSEEDMGALSLTLQVREHQAQHPTDEAAYGRLVASVQQAVNEDQEQREPTHTYEVEVKPGNGGWRVLKRPIGASGGVVLGEYAERSAADAVAGVMNALRDKEIGR